MRRAFTIAELLVVIIIISAIFVVTLPRFADIAESSAASLARERIQGAISGARAAAIQSTGDADIALVFLYRPGQVTIGAYRQVGIINDNGTVNRRQAVVPREIFVPVIGTNVLNLPSNWMVRGFASATSFDSEWYGQPNDRYDDAANNWIFPENDIAVGGRYRQSFMLRFEAGTGRLLTGSTKPAIVFEPSNIESATDRLNVPEDWMKPGERYDDPAKLVRRILNDPDLEPFDRQVVLGYQSSHTVLVRPVSRLALYNIKELAGALGVRLNDQLKCLYRYEGIADGDTLETWDDTTDRAPTLVDDVDPKEINAWMYGDTNLDGRIVTTDDGEEADSPRAQLFSIDRTTGSLINLEVVR